MQAEKTQSLVVFLLLVSLSGITVLWGHEQAQTMDNIRVWDWINVIVLLIGLPFILLQQQAGFPELLDQRISNKNRFLLPALTGITFGLLDVLVVKIILHPEPYESLPPFLQPFPYSISLYSSGALEVEIFYRLIPLTLLMLAGHYIAKGKYTTLFFWLAAVLTSLREPLEQFPDGALWFVCYSLLTGFLMNFLQAVYFRKAGFLASLFVRLGHYLVWHILLGIYVEYVELQ